jgi:hypothetical protein
MASVLGTGISVDDIKWVFLVLIVADFMVQTSFHGDLGAPTVLDKYVFGYPECKTDYCFMPSSTELTGAFNALNIRTPPSDFAKFAADVMVGLFSSLWVMFKLVSCLIALWVPLSVIMKWDTFWTSKMQGLI